MIEIIEYSSEYKQYFYEINREWIEDMFVMEEHDENVLKNPEEYIINNGGYIWFVKHPELGIIGTCALMKKGDDYELTKMGVSQKSRGLKIGEKLLCHVIEFVKSHQLKCFLLTNKDCKAAIHLYEKNGFVHSTEVRDKYATMYERCNVAMRLQ